MAMALSAKSKAAGETYELKGMDKAKTRQITSNASLEIKVTLDEPAGRVRGFVGRREMRRKDRAAGRSPTVLNGNIGHSG